LLQTTPISTAAVSIAPTPQSFTILLYWSGYFLFSPVTFYPKFLHEFVDRKKNGRVLPIVFQWFSQNVSLADIISLGFFLE